MNAHAVAEYLISEASMTADGPFLLARLVTDQLRSSPVDTSLKNWTDRVGHSVEDAFDRDLAAVGPPQHRQVERRAPAVLARSLVSALTWGYGGGFPEEEWLAAANAIARNQLQSATTCSGCSANWAAISCRTEKQGWQYTGRRTRPWPTL